MSEKELSQYYWLKQEIKKIEDRIIEFGDGIGSTKYNDSIKSTKKMQSIQEKRAELVEQYLEFKLSALEKYLEIERYIETIEDSEIRQLMRLRFLDLMDWSTIGKELNCDRTTAARKVRKFIKMQKVAHKSH